MSLSDLASLGSFLSGIAVLGSFAFLAIQIRQSGNNQRAAIHIERAGLVQELSAYAYGGRDNAELMMRGNAADVSLDPAQSMQYLYRHLSTFRLFEEWFHQHGDGMMDDVRWQSNELRMRSFLTMPGFRAAWRTQSSTFVPEFRRWVDQMMRDVSVDPNARDRVATWRDFCREELAAPKT